MYLVAEKKEELLQQGYVDTLDNSRQSLVILLAHTGRLSDTYPTEEMTNENDHDLLALVTVRPVQALE